MSLSQLQAQVLLEQTQHLLGNNGVLRRLVEERKTDDTAALLERAGAQAHDAFSNVARFLANGYLPKARNVPAAVGVDGWVEAAQDHLGLTLDPRKTYQEAWERRTKTMNRIRRFCHEHWRDEMVAEIVHRLNTDSTGVIRGSDNLVTYLEDRFNSFVDQLNGKHFDIPPQLQTLAVRLVPGVGARSFLSASEGFVDGPGTYVIPTDEGEKSGFPKRREACILAHETVPGHQLQEGWALLNRKRPKYLRHLCPAGFDEGWADYVEAYMVKTGLFDESETLDQLLNELFRDTRVILDLGLHCRFHIPKYVELLDGTKWTCTDSHWNMKNAEDFLIRNADWPEGMLRSEIVRYLCDPTQAASYAIGHEVIDSLREQYADLDDRTFHRRVLDAGPAPLGVLGDVMALTSTFGRSGPGELWRPLGD